jgi:hypothetical protein
MISLDTVWDAMRAAADAEQYMTAYRIAENHGVTWMCPVCVARPVAQKTVPMPLTPRDAALALKPKGEVPLFSAYGQSPLDVFDTFVPDDHCDMPVCNTCAGTWPWSFISKRYLETLKRKSFWHE